MSRALISLTMWLLVVSAASAASLAHGATSLAVMIIHGPTFRYSLTEDRDPAVCKHMLSVFNDKFTRLWDAPPMTSLTNDPIYSPNGKYAFPRLPGVKYNAEVTFNWRFFSQPTSPEFSAIHWKEGMAFPGGCPAGKVCSGEQPFPVLIAHFYFDNDGTQDTVIKQGYFPGYLAVPTAQEYLTVLRNQVFMIHGVVNLWDLAHPRNSELTSIINWGMYLRPFIYQNQTYVTKYVLDFGESNNPNIEPNPPPWTRPEREDMLVQQYSFTGQKQEFTGRPEWTIRTVCDFEMKPLN